MEQRDPRIDAILDSVKATFAAKGFDGASMQDLAQGAGMSAGNFYRYFRSKSALIEAMVEREIACLRERFAEILAARDPLGAFRAVVQDRLSRDDLHGRLWAEIEAAAARRPELESLLRRMEGEIAGSLVAVFARIAGVPEAEAEARYAAHARLLLLLIQSVSMRRGARPADPSLAALVLRLIDHTLAEIAAAPRPGLARSAS